MAEHDLLSVVAVPEHLPAELHVSGSVQGLLSLQELPGEQLPVHAPLTQACDTHALHAPLEPPPHIAVVWFATGTQALPLQQPPGHELASHTHFPPVQRCPLPQATPQAPQLLLSVLVLTHVPQHLPVAHWMSLLQAVVALVILLVHWLLLVLQYSLEVQLFGVAVPQLPAPSQVDDNTALQSELHWLGQAVCAPGNTHDGWVPSQYFFPQVPVPVQLVRGVVRVLHWPRVWLHDWHSPSHLALQQ